MSSAVSDVVKFYAGKTIFLTGGTGFLGKALLEKILYSCSDISKIYVLVRKKKGKSAQERINQMLNIPAFDRLKSRPGWHTKITALPGDVTVSNLGLSDDQLRSFIDEVSIVFHLAATVNFNETLQEALDVNVIGTVEVIKLCHQMKNLKAFVHVSTAFSNADRSNIDEVVYPPPHTLEQAFDAARLYSNDKHYVTQFIGGKPNTYTYSKALAEDIVVTSRGHVPAVIVRPSIVMASLNEPCPGWIDNWNGATALFIGMPSGMLKVALGRDGNVTDLIPVDIVTNLMIVAATKCFGSKDVMVYNCCSGSSNPVTQSECKQIARQVALKCSLNVYPWPYLIFTSSYILYYIIFYLLQILPSYIFDLLPVKKKSEPHVNIQMKFNKMVHLVSFFLLKQWNFSDDNVKKLWQSMSEKDRTLFNFDVKSIDWNECIESYIIGARKHLLKDNRF